MGKYLYEISKVLDTARDKAKQEAAINDEPIKDYVSDVLNSLEGDVIEQAGLLYKDLDSFNSSIDAEVKRLNAMKKEHIADMDKIKEFLKDKLDGNKYKTEKVTIKVTKSKAVDLKVEAEELPTEYQKVKITPNKRLITESIKNGLDISKYAELKETQSISIK